MGTYFFVNTSQENVSSIYALKVKGPGRYQVN